MKIYLIDDDPNILNILKIIIQTRNLGEICGLCSSPIDALEDLKYIKPDIVMVDLLMPGMDGITFVGQAKAQYPDIGYIMLSQVSNKDMISSAYESGVEFFIQKPINAIEVENVLSRVIQSITMKRALSSMQNIFAASMQDVMPKAPAQKKEPAHITKAKDILQRLGIIGEIGSKDIDIKVKEDGKPVWKNLVRSYHMLGGGKDEKIIFHGKGKGDGLGLSAWGARGMANSNAKLTYKDILRHYYPQTSLVQR